MYCNTLQHTATHCNTRKTSHARLDVLTHVLQHTATHCNTLQHTHDIVFTHVYGRRVNLKRLTCVCIRTFLDGYCSTVQGLLDWFEVDLGFTMCIHTQCVCGRTRDVLTPSLWADCTIITCCSALQDVTVCCSVLQCVAVCCSVLQCVRAYLGRSDSLFVGR